MKNIQSREDIHTLVTHFYAKVRKDPSLGPIFNQHITQDQWPLHLEKLTDFWESNLFDKQIYRGSPTKKHIQVDTNLHHTIEQTHFSRWLQLWFQTINELYTGEVANKAKNRARKMATGQYIAIWKNR